MKYTIESLAGVIELYEINPEMFYDITLGDSEIKLQGWSKSELIKHLMTKGFVFIINEMGHITAEQLSEKFNLSIRIVLT